jgi:hypothetical protein
MSERNVSAKLLTKSKFSQSWECPRKLYYSNNKEYGSTMLNDPFLRALALGGFQVGALAQKYFPGGILVDTLDKTKALAQTQELLQKDRIIIFEGAFQFENLFIRADIVRKTGKFIELIEVKAKSMNSEEEFPIWAKRAFKAGKFELLADYKDKIIDLAFQTHVLQSALPQLTVRSFLMLADKAQTASVDGLNQLFKIVRDEKGRDGVKVSAGVEMKDLGTQVLNVHELTDDIKHIFNDVVFDGGPRFVDVIQKLARLAESNAPGDAVQSSACKHCEFRVDESAKVKSGFKQCWSALGLKEKDIESRPFVFDLWNFRGSQKMLDAGLFYLDQLTEEELKVKANEKANGLSSSERQMIQVEFARGSRKSPGMFFDVEGFRREISELKFPLHFIDFETSMMAIPFHKGRRPYEQMAFQFSHHVLHKDGRVEHRSEYLDERVGVFPNFDFVRALKKALSSDDGCVLRFAAHENTVLNQIRRQLLDSSEADAGALAAWIESLTTPPGDSGEWEPVRQFVDMCELTKRFYYLPATAGSNSIKAILPAVLSVAGRDLSLRESFVPWIKSDGAGGFLDPYSLLPRLFDDVSAEEMARVEVFLSGGDELADGGAAMMAWARMQFSEMSGLERSALAAGLKRYCALDTLAMVMVWEWWQLVIAKDKKRVA